MKAKSSVLLIITVSLLVLTLFGIVAMFNSNNNAPKDIKNIEAFKKDTATQPTQGKTPSKVTLIEFGDYTCPYCGDFERKIKPQLKRDYIDSGKVEFRYVNVLIHETSMRGSRASLAVHNIAPKAYWDFHHFLYQHQPKSKKDTSEKPWLSDQLIKEGLDKIKITDAQKQAIIRAYQAPSDASLNHAKANHQLAKKYQLKQVPTLYVNGKRIENITDYEEIKKTIDDEIEKSK